MAGKFVLKASNGPEIGRSRRCNPECGCRNGIRSVPRKAATAGIVLPG